MIKLIQYFISKMNTLKITFITLFFLLSSGNIISKEKGVLLMQGAGNISEISSKLTEKIE